MNITLKDGAKTPTKAYPGDAGLDLYVHSLAQGEFLAVGFGVHVEIPSGYFGMLALRSSVGKRGYFLPNGVGVIDCGYRGELKAVVYSTKGSFDICVGDKLAQLVLIPVLMEKIEVVDALQSTERNNKGFGSSI